MLYSILIEQSAACTSLSVLMKRKTIDIDLVEEVLTRIGIIKEVEEVVEVEVEEEEQEHADHFIGPLEAFYIKLLKNNEDDTM